MHRTGAHVHIYARTNAAHGRARRHPTHAGRLPRVECAQSTKGDGPESKHVSCKHPPDQGRTRALGNPKCVSLDRDIAGMVTSVHVPWHVPNQARPYLFLPWLSIPQSHQACSRKHEVYLGCVAKPVGMGSCHVMSCHVIGLSETFVGACLCLPLPASACL